MRRRNSAPPLALEESLQTAAVLDRDHLPAGRLEHPRQASERDVGHHPVERLAVEVHHPQHLAQPRHPRIGDRLPDRTLVQLRITQQSDLASHRRRLEAMRLQIPARHRAPHRRRRAEAHRPRGVIHRIRVLRPRRIALQAPELAQRLEVALVQAPQQIVDRVQRRRGVRLDRHPVLGPQLREPQRRHQRHHRGARGLMASHLHPGAVLTHPVRVMDDRRGQPQHPALDAPQGVEVRARELRRRRRRGL